MRKKGGILSDPQIGHGIFTMLASVILPAIISAIEKNMNVLIHLKEIVNTKTFILQIYI